MPIRVLFIRPIYAHARDGHVRSGLLPYHLRVEIADPGTHLTIEMLYATRRRRADPMTLPRWTLVYDEYDGRLLRFDFREDRSDPETPYDEIAEALDRTVTAAAALPQDWPWHFGLLASARAVAHDWFARVDVLRPALKPPYSDVP